MAYNLLNEENKKIYNNYINENESFIYHTLEWKEIIQNTYGFKPYYVVFGSEKKIDLSIPFFMAKGFLKGNRLISLPYCHHVPILSHDVELKKELLYSFKNLLNDFNYIEIKDLIKEKQDYLYNKTENFGTIINKSDYVSEENYFFNLNDSTKRSIKKAKKFIQIKQGNTDDMYDDFYKLILQTRTRQGTPVYPKIFFQQLKKNLREKTIFFSAFFNGKLCASIMMLYHKNIALYAYGGSFNNEEAMNKRPMDLLIYQSIIHAFENKYNIYDFGSTPKFHKNLLAFKKKFSKNIYDITYTVLSYKKFVPYKREGISAKAINFLIKNSPEFFNKKIGPIIFKECA